MLNLQKNDILDLTKKDPSLDNLILAGGWDPVKKGLFSFKADYDLDLSAIQLNQNGKLLSQDGIIYFGRKKAEGIFLHGDNLTGAGAGDDEKISISLKNLSSECHKILFLVCIYEGESRKQGFTNVKNAYVRLLNSDKGNSEICRYNLTEDGGDNTAIIFAELSKTNGEWQFKAVGELLRSSVSKIANMYR